MPGIGGRFGWNEPPPAAIDHDLGLEHLVLVGGDAERAVFELLQPDTMRLKVNCGSNGAICFISLSTRSCAEIDGQRRNVVDRLFRIELGALAARPVENVDQVAFHVEAGRVRTRQTGRPARHR